MAKKLMLIDGHSILNRAFYGIPDLTNSEGIHTNAMYGFLNIMFKFLDEEKPDYLTVAFDLSAPTFRHKTFAEYKGTRKPAPDEFRQQVPLIKEVLKAMNISIVQMEGYEADDLLGTIAKKSASQGIEVSIISGDRDLLQLADEHIKIRIPKTKKGVTEVEDYYPLDVVNLYGVTPSEFIDVKALMGDTSDNIPGAPGIGEKTASVIIQKYHSIENVIENIENLTPPKAKKSVSENIEQIRLSRFLAEININVPIDYDIEEAGINNFYNPESYELYKRFNFKSYLKRFEGVSLKQEFDVYNNFKIIESFNDAEKVFDSVTKTLEKGDNIGFSVMYEEGVNYGVAIAINNIAKGKENTDKEDIINNIAVYYIPMLGFISEGYLNEKLKGMADICKNNGKRQLITLNLKNILDVFMDKENSELLVEEGTFVDVSLGAYLLNPNEESYEYDNLARDYLGVTVNSSAEILGKSKIKEAAFINIDSVCKIAGLRAYMSLVCWEKVKDILLNKEMLELFYNIEMPLLFVLYDMEVCGIRVDKDGLLEYSKVLKERIDELEKDIFKEAGEEFNINSPKQLGVILFEKLGLPNGKKTKSGYSTAADVLDKLAPQYPIVEKIQEYRQLSKLKSTYADGLVEYISEDGRIHGKFNQTITATGRISSTEPNLQNIPIRMEMGKKIRQVFKPKENYVFLDADYSQIELRILAHMSDDEKLIEAYNSEEDIHKITASQVFNVSLNEVTPELRRNAKAVNFGIIYGISSFGLSQDLSISKKEAQAYIEQYFETYPKIKGFIDKLVSDAKEKGYSLTMFNRRRPIPELSSSNYMQRSFGERVAMNAPIQGSAADIIKLAMIRVYKGLKENNMKSKLILQVHDELLVETHKDEIEQVKKIIEDGMKEAVKLKVSLEIDLNQGENWLEAH